MSCLKKLRYVLALTFFQILASCGAAEDIVNTPEENNKDFGPGENGYAGKWEGHLVDKRSDAPTSLIEVNMVFEEDGTFELTSPEDRSIYANGSYTLFSTSVIFKIEKSSISAFGVSGEAKEFEFSQIGSKLECFNNNTEIKLQNTGSTTSTEEEQVKGEILHSTWFGLDKKMNSWKLQISKENVFFASIESNVSNPLTISGTFTTTVEEGETQSIKFEITDSNNEGMIGLIMAGTITEKNELIIQVYDHDGVESQKFQLLR